MKNYEHSEDLFSDTRMSFGEHLEDLRVHLFRALKWFVAGMVISFFIGSYVVKFIREPVEEALVKYHIEYYKKHGDRNKLLERLQQTIEEERKKGPNADPNLMKFVQPTPIQMSLSEQQLDDWMRRRYPRLFEQGGPLYGSPRPDSTAKVEMTTIINPSELTEQLQAPMMILAKRTVLTSLSAQETFMVYFKVCILTGFVISSPLVFYHLWSFVAAGLYPHEKRLVNVYLPFSLFLFLGGVAICQFAIIPAALSALLEFNLWLNVEPDFRLNEWLSFAIWMPVITGLCFQTPLVMLMLGKVGVFTQEQFASKRKIAIFVMLIVVAIISPSVDIASLLLMWVPMVALYELGIYLVKWTVKPSPTWDDVEVPYDPDQEAQVSSNSDGYSETTPRD